MSSPEHRRRLERTERAIGEPYWAITSEGLVELSPEERARGRQIVLMHIWRSREELEAALRELAEKKAQAEAETRELERLLDDESDGWAKRRRRFGEPATGEGEDRRRRGAA